MTRAAVLIIVGMAFVGMCLWASLLSERLRRANESLAAVSAAHAETLGTLDRLVDDHARIVSVMDAVRISESTRASAMAAMIGDIDHAPESDDGPVAPVLRRALDGLNGN